MYILRNIRLMAVLCLAAPLLGCSEKDIVPDREAIVFSTPDHWDGQNTRTVMSDDGRTSFIANDMMGVYADYVPGGGLPTQHMMVNQWVKYDGESWTYSPLVYWHVGTGAEWNFYAYYPYVDLTPPAILDPTAIEISGVDTDWLWSTLTTSQGSGAISLQFHHALAGIRLKVSCAAGMDSPVMKSAVLRDTDGNLPYGGTLNIGTTDKMKAGQVTPADDRVANITMPFNPAGEALSTTPVSACIYIPEYNDIPDGRLFLDFVFNIDGTDEAVSFALPSTKKTDPKYPYSYIKDNCYTYNLILGEDKSVGITSITIDGFDKESPIDVLVGTNN